MNVLGVGAYKPDTQKEYTECCEVEQFDFFSKLVMEWEKAASLDAEAKEACRVVTIRSGVVLGKQLHTNNAKQCQVIAFL